MKHRIAAWLVGIARRLDPQKKYEFIEQYEPVQLGVGYHISKQDVRKFRKTHEEYTSHRKGLDALVGDTKQVIIGNIAAGLVEKGLLTFKVKRSLWTATVEGKVVVYAKKKEAGEETAD
jgi:hypothetical protein